MTGLLKNGEEPLFSHSPLKVLPIEPAGLDYCRRHGLSDQFELRDWSTPATSFHTADEELLVIDSTVIWTLGTALKRVYGFETEGQRVRQALFAYFPNSQALFKNEPDPVIPQLGMETQAPSRLSVLNKALKSTANVVHSQQSSQGKALERALVVILDDIAHVYHDDGRRDLVNLPFPVQRVFAKEVGLIFEREIKSVDFPRAVVSIIDTVPKFFTLDDPMEQMGLICPDSQSTKQFTIEDTLSYADDKIIITHRSKDQTLTFWRVSKSNHTPSRSRLNNSSGQLSRRRSSMRASVIGLPRPEDFTAAAEERPLGSLQADMSAHVDRMPFQDIDHNSLFNTADNLRKDVLLEHLETILHAGFERPKIVQIPVSASLTRFHVLCPVECTLLDIHLEKKRSGRYSLTQIRRDQARSALRLRIDGVQTLMVQDMYFNALLRLQRESDILVAKSPAPQHLFAYDEISFITKDASNAMLLHYLPSSNADPEEIRIMQAFLKFMTSEHYRLFSAALWAARQIQSSVTQSPLGALMTTIYAILLVQSDTPSEEVRSVHNQTDDINIDRIVVARRLSASINMISLQIYAPQMLISLHFIFEELSISDLTRRHGKTLLKGLAQIAYWLRWEQYVDYYTQQLELDYDLAVDDSLVHLDFPEPANGPTSIVRWVTSIMSGKRCSLTNLDSLLAASKPASAPCHSDDGTVSQPLCPMSLMIERVFSSLADPHTSLHDVVDIMMHFPTISVMLETLHKSFAIPLKDIIHQCAMDPAPRWRGPTLTFIGRSDLTNFVSEESQVTEYGDTTLVGTESNKSPSSAFIFQNSEPHEKFVDLIFDQDRRMQEIEKILNCSKPAVVQWKSMEQYGEAEMIRQQEKLARLVALRTMAIPIGLAICAFNTYQPLPTQRFQIPRMNFDVKIRPMQVTVTEDKTFLTTSLKAWPIFHNGVAAGLSIASSAAEISASWIVFNRPEDFSNGHAGFLLGLGLNGHLKAMATWHAFNYLTSKHTMTSIGLLLGLSASFLGSMDPMVAKLLSVHILALLPAGSNELNLSGETQAAGLIGIGLLHFGTGHHGMSEALIKEIVNHDQSSEHFRNESYRLSAGIALGMINVGRGKAIQGHRDLTFELKLINCIEGSDREMHDLDVKMPGAIVALGLLYLRTNDAYVANRLAVPATKYAQSYIRPDLFLLRALARGLILWERTMPTTDYILNELPDSLKNQFDLRHLRHHDHRDQMLLNVVAGACLAIGIKFAGSLDESCRDFILGYLDRLISIVAIDDHGMDHKYSRVASRTVLGVLCLSASMIMAGSGDLETLRRLRRLHYRIDADTWYGNYMAVNMSIGLLFMSQGRSSLCSTDLAVCAFVAAFYPVFPNSTTDNHSHLQALRHLWVLGAQSRCIDPRDTATNQSCLVPITVHFRNPSRMEQHMMAPCLLPPLEEISSILLDSTEHWPVSLNFSESAQHLKMFRKNQIIYVTRRLDHDARIEGLKLLTTTLPSTHESKADMVQDILAALPNQAASDEECLTRAIEADDDWHWTRLAIRTGLHNEVKDLKQTINSEIYNMLFTYWQACTSGFLAAKFSKSVRLCLDENFVQQLKLELWKRSNDSIE